VVLVAALQVQRLRFKVRKVLPIQVVVVVDLAILLVSLMAAMAALV
jgi:hypothetical protein